MTQPITQPITQPLPRKARSASSKHYGVCQPATHVAKDNWITHISIGVDMVYLGTHDTQLMAALHWDVANMMIYGPDCLHLNTGISFRSTIPKSIEKMQRYVIIAFLRPKGQRVLEKNPLVKAALQRWIDARDAEQDERFATLPEPAPITSPAMLDGVHRVATTTTSTSAKPCINVHYVIGPEGVERMETSKLNYDWLLSPLGGPSKSSTRGLWCRLKDALVRLWRDEY